MDVKTDRRQHPRHPTPLIVKYTVQSGTFRDLLRNVSAGGAYINTWRDIPSGQPINLRFPLHSFDYRLVTRGIVIRSQHSGFAVKFNNPIDDPMPPTVQ
jgi:hypothetical protein